LTESTGSPASGVPVQAPEAGTVDWMNWRELDPLSFKRPLLPSPDDFLVVRASLAADNAL